jgi:hypothetical protein
MITSTDVTAAAKHLIARLRGALFVPDLTEANDNYAWPLVRSHFADGRTTILWAPSRLHDGPAIDFLEINTPPHVQNQGLAKAALRDFLAACDRCGITVTTQIIPLDPSKSARMVAWLECEGFVVDDDHFGYRTPQLPRR